MNENNIDRTLSMKKFKVFSTSILLMDEMKSAVISQANYLINNLSSELSNILPYSSKQMTITYTENLKVYEKMFGKGAIQLLAFDAIFYSIANFEKFLKFIPDFSLQHDPYPEFKKIIPTLDFHREMKILKDRISNKFGITIHRSTLLNCMLEFMIKEKKPQIEYVVLPNEISYLSFKIKNERNSLARGYKRRIMQCIYSRILTDMIKGLYKEDLNPKDNIAMNLTTDENEISKSEEMFKGIEIRTREELNKKVVTGREVNEPKQKFDLSLLNEEEQTMREAVNGFMASYGNRYVYESEANFIVELLNKVSNNSVSLQQLKAALA